MLVSIAGTVLTKYPNFELEPAVAQYRKPRSEKADVPPIIEGKNSCQGGIRNDGLWFNYAKIFSHPKKENFFLDSVRKPPYYGKNFSHIKKFIL